MAVLKRGNARKTVCWHVCSRRSLFSMGKKTLRGDWEVEMRESNEGDGKWVCVWGRGGECILVGKRTASNETTKDTIIKSRGIVWKKGRWKSEVEILLAWEFAYVSVTEAAWRHINHIWNTSTIIHCLGVILIILSRTANDSPVSPRGWNQRRHRERGKEEDKVMRERRGEGKKRKEKKRHARGRRRGRISQRKQCVS